MNPIYLEQNHLGNVLSTCVWPHPFLIHDRLKNAKNSTLAG